MELIRYTPPPTVRSFIMDHRPSQLFYDWIVGPLGSGKTTALFMKLVYMAKLQARGHDGVRHSRAVIVRKTIPQLKDTTIKSWDSWFKDGVAGTWYATERNFMLRFDDVECEVLFRPLDTDDDIGRVLSLEVTFAIVDEFIEIPKAIIDALSGRCGRFPAMKDGGATNFGMWGSSNPGTEDNWWYDHLHDELITELISLYGAPAQVAKVKASLKNKLPALNTRYFHQPSGASPHAENVENLPPGYYPNQAIGKAFAWIKQFIDAEWGFSASDTPVVKTFNPTIHVMTRSLTFSTFYPLVIGFDPGLGGTAMVMGQEDMHGRLIVLGELTATGMGTKRFISDRVKPYLKQHFPRAEVIIAPDPASANKQPLDERTVVEELKKHFAVKIETNNRLMQRLNAIEAYTTRLTDDGPALLVDKHMCPKLVRALGGGWRFSKEKRYGQMKPDPEKNEWSHIGDAFGYLCRYFDKAFQRDGKHGTMLGQQPQVSKLAAPVPRYHFR